MKIGSLYKKNEIENLSQEEKKNLVKIIEKSFNKYNNKMNKVNQNFAKKADKNVGDSIDIYSNGFAKLSSGLMVLALTSVLFTSASYTDLGIVVSLALLSFAGVCTLGYSCDADVSLSKHPIAKRIDRNLKFSQKLYDLVKE